MVYTADKPLFFILGEVIMSRQKLNHQYTIKDFAGIIAIIIIISAIAYYLNLKTFDAQKFNVSEEYQIVKELSSSKYQGRLAGSSGNMMSLKYIENYFKKIGIVPCGDNGTYYQNFKSMVPVFNSSPVFNVIDKNGNIIKKYEAGRDFTECLDGFGGASDTNGKIMYLKDSIRNYKPKDIKGKILAVDGIMNDNEIEYAIDNGVKALLYPSDSYLPRTPVSTSDKKGKTIPIIIFSRNVFNEITGFSKSNLSAQINLDIQYKMLETPNIIGKIEGRDKNSGCIILSSHIDGVGSYPNGFYYPEASGSASDTALILEIAKTIKSQNNIPDKTIIFAIWNNEEYGMKGKEYYSQNPVYPINKSNILYFKNFGSNQFSWYKIDYSNDSSDDTGMSILKDRLYQYFTTFFPLKSTSNFNSMNNNSLSEISVEALTKNSDFIYTKENNISSISINQMKQDGKCITKYIKKDIYGDIIGDLLNNIEKSFLCFLIISLIIIYIINKLNTLNPDIKIINMRVESIYFSRSYGLFENIIFYTLQGFLILLSVVIVSYIPHNFDIFFVNGKFKTNFTLNQVLTNSIGYIRMLFTKGFGQVDNNLTRYNVTELISYSFIRSSLLLLTATVFSVIAGIIKGISDGFLNNKNVSLGSIGTLILLSIPDVMIVVLVQLLFVYLNNHHILNVLNSYREFKRFLVSFLSLVILPSVYITRIASTAANEESKKEYIKMARAKGLSNFYIIKNHLFISVFIKVIDSLPSILNLMISNLIVVEYLYYYPGIVYNLMLCYNENQVVAFTGLAITFCALYIVFLAIFNAISVLVNPLKREGIR